MPHVSELHAQHDPLLVASLVAGDLAGADRDRANAQVSACTDCATLHADLIAIARATAALPPAVAPRDFRLSREQAEALRPVGWRRLVAIGGSRPLLSRQLGIGLATIGIAGLLVSTLPGIQLGGSAAVAEPSTREAATSADQRSGVSGDQVTIAGEGVSPVPANLGPMSNDGSSAAASRSAGDTFGGAVGLASGLQSSPAAAAPAASTGAFAPSVGDAAATPAARSIGQDNAEPATPTTSPAADSGQNLLAIGSIIALAAGIALLAVRRLARRPI